MKRLIKGGTKSSLLPKEDPGKKIIVLVVLKFHPNFKNTGPDRLHPV